MNEKHTDFGVGMRYFDLFRYIHAWLGRTGVYYPRWGLRWICALSSSPQDVFSLSERKISVTEVILALIYLAIFVLVGFVAYRAGFEGGYGSGFTQGYADGCKDGEFLAAIRQVSR